MPLMQQPFTTSAAAATWSPSGFSENALKRVTQIRSLLEELLDRVGVAGPHHALVADQQDVVQAELRRQRAGAGDDAGPENQAGPRLPVDEGGWDGEVHGRGGMPEARCRVVVDHADGLHERVADRRADEAEAAPPERLAHGVRFRRLAPAPRASTATG